MSKWQELDAVEREEAISQIESMVRSHPGWKAFALWMEDRVEHLNDLMGSMPIQTDQDKIAFEVVRQERKRWLTLARRADEFVRQAQDNLNRKDDDTDG